MPVDPHSNEVRYALSLVGQLLASARPRSVRIASRSPEIVDAVVRRLSCGDVTILVENADLQARIADSLGIAVDVTDGRRATADAAVFPFSLEEGLRPAGERTIVAACYNALSYKSLVGLGRVKGTIFAKLARLRRGYDVHPAGSMFSPVCVALLGLAKLAERVSSPLYFRLEDLAMRRLIEFGPIWTMSYVVVVVGRRTD